MTYRMAYPYTGGYGIAPNVMSNGYDYEESDSLESDSSGSEDYDYRARMITRETRCPRDIVRAPTPPPIIKRVVERAPTPEAPVMERIIIRPQAQEIVERVIEQPCTPPPRIVQKEMHEEAPPPIVRTRVIKVDRPVLCGFSQPSSPYSHAGYPFRARSVAGSVGQPAVFQDNNLNFSSESSFECAPPAAAAAPPPMMMIMMMPPSMRQPAPPPSRMMYPPPRLPFSSYMYPVPRPAAVPYGYPSMIPSGMPMPMMATGTNQVPQVPFFANQQNVFSPMNQQLAY